MGFMHHTPSFLHGMLAVHSPQTTSSPKGHDLLPLVSQCSQLEDLDLSGLALRAGNVEAVLPSFTRLSTFSTSQPGLVGKAVHAYAMQDPPPPPLKLDTAVQFDSSCSLRDRHQVTRLFSIIPNVTDVNLSDFNEETAIGLIEISNPIQKLEVESNVQFDFNTQRRLMEKFSQSLTKLIITAHTVIWDIGLIAQYCLNLEHLDLRTIMSIAENFQVTQEHFAKLITCSLTQMYESRETVTYFRLPDDFVRQVFSLPLLHTMSMCRLEFPSELITEICEQASSQERGGALSCLKNLGWADVRGPTLEHFMALICASPRLTRATVLPSESFSRQDRHLFHCFCTRFLPDIRTEDYLWLVEDHSRSMEN